ncbi:MAG: hotdog fold thioesterase [Dorea sp.]|nr:hotdog fold thioesterase [Dorea sp.]
MFELKDVDFIEEDGEKFRLSMTPNEKNANVNGFVHGGIIFTLADESIGRYVTKQGRVGAAADADIHYYRPAKIGEKLTATVNERKVGKKLGIYLIEVTNPAGKLVADAMLTIAFVN